MAKKRGLKNKLEYLAFRLSYALVAPLPRPWTLALGAGMGKLAARVLHKRSTLARTNLRQAFPQKSPAECEQILRQMFRQLGISAMEMLLLPRLHQLRALEEYFDFEGLEHLHQAHRQGKGVILLSAHLGLWECGSIFLPRLGFPAAFVAKSMKNPRLDAYLTKVRQSSGCVGINAKQGARRILRALNENMVVGILPDQHARPRQAIRSRFFGRPAWTTPVIAQIALKTGAPVVSSFIYRQADNRYLAVFAPISTCDQQGNPLSTEACTQVFNDHIEAAIRRQPDQWFWLHRRWRA
jgi:KDO2-lipid IV(A) lauroyltransferase